MRNRIVLTLLVAFLACSGLRASTLNTPLYAANDVMGSGDTVVSPSAYVELSLNSGMVLRLTWIGAGDPYIIWASTIDGDFSGGAGDHA